MKRLALKLLLFLLVFLAYDKLFILVANRSAETELDRRLEYLIKGQINKDVVIIGSSRGSRDIIAGQIEEKTGLSAYNLCYPGSSVEFHDFILQTLLKFNKHPEILVLIVDDNNAFMDEGDRIVFRRDRLYPLVRYPYIWKEMAQRGYLDNELAGFIVLQRLNKYNFDLRQKRPTPLDTIMACGSMPISWQDKGIDWEFPSKEKAYSMEEEVPEKVAAFRNMVQTCEANSIELVIAFPPNYQIPSQSFENRIRQLSGTHVHFHHYNMENLIYMDKDYFFDTEHLMCEAAHIYTDEVIDFLRQLMPL
jgi:hypothetical protein